MKNKSILSCLMAAGITGAAAITTYAYLLRPRHLRWGATDAEVDLDLPGDDLVSYPKIKATHAVNINTKPHEVWPWIVQIGQGRGGFYSYDWIENLGGLDIHSADRILPDFQDLKSGDVIPLAPDGFGVPVAIIEPEKALVLHGDTRQVEPDQIPVFKPGDYLAVGWGFYLNENPDGSTRLIERFQADWNPTCYNAVFYRVFLEPGSFIMERKMLLGIKERAESQAEKTKDVIE